MSIEKINELESQVKQMQKTIEQLKQENITKEKELNLYKLPRKEYQKYCFINYRNFGYGFCVSNTNDDGCESDNNKYNQYNYFTNENKAQQYVDHIKLTLELFQIRDLINGDWKPDWGYDSKPKYTIENAYNKFFTLDTKYYYYAPLTFETPEKRDKFIELVGKDKIINFLSF